MNNKWDSEDVISGGELKSQAAAVCLTANGSVNGILVTGGGPSTDVQVQENCKLVTKTPLMRARQSHSVVVLIGQVQVLGGQDGEFQLSCCERLSLDTWEWTWVRAMNIAREATSACAVGDRYIYVFGGQDGKGKSDKIERYDVSTDTWIVLEVVMPQPLSRRACIPIPGNQIILLGGYNKKSCYVKNVDLFDPKTEKWVELAPMIRARSLRNKVFQHGGYIQALGGSDSLDGERYSVDDNEWQLLPTYAHLANSGLQSWSAVLK